MGRKHTGSSALGEYSLPEDCPTVGPSGAWGLRGDAVRRLRHHVGPPRIGDLPNRKTDVVGGLALPRMWPKILLPRNRAS